MMRLRWPEATATDPACRAVRARPASMQGGVSAITQKWRTQVSWNSSIAKLSLCAHGTPTMLLKISTATSCPPSAAASKMASWVQRLGIEQQAIHVEDEGRRRSGQSHDGSVRVDHRGH